MLVVDDEEPIRRVFDRIGKSLQWSVTTAEDGYQAMDILQNETFQIFVVDVKMPGPSGTELAQEILKKEQTSAVIIISGYEKFEDESELKKMGIYNYIQKGNLSVSELKDQLLQAAQFHEEQSQG
jgi:DNA-binding NtrC family response regulator